MSTGIYVRIRRENSLVNLEIEDLTDEELRGFFSVVEDEGFDRAAELSRWCITLAKQLRPAPLVYAMGEQTIREMAVELPRQGRLAVTVVTGDQTLRRDETKLVASELREIADVYENMSTPEEN
jgi:hypothetical protein